MIYKLIYHPKLKFKITFLNIFLIICYTASLYSCETTRSYSVNPDSIGKISSQEITRIELKNGETINCRNMIIKFENGTDSARYIILRSYTSGADFKTYWTEKRIPEKDIRKIYLEKTETNNTKTVIYVSGIVIALILIALVVSTGALKMPGFKKIY